MNKMRKASVAATTRGNERSKNICTNVYISRLHYITILLAATTVIAAWNITDIWSGIVALLCAMATVGLFYISIGEE